MSEFDDDEPITLSAHALAALQEFKTEEKTRLEKFEQLYQESEDKFDQQQAPKNITIDDFKEDWQLSQFWYSDETAMILGKALLEGADEDTVVVIASAPSVYAAIKQLPQDEVPTKHIYLLEYDPRFKVLAGNEHFSVYDYNKPNDIPSHLRNKCHRLLIDPPFLEEECQTKSAESAKNLLVKDKTSKTKSGDLKYKLISSTGERMHEVVLKNYPDTKMTDFLPEHKNGLSNEFRCYANFEGFYWKFK
ncbi:EFM5 [Candida pseudojiufengensis]|uniref:EFM5 n=1 Tax=Candida pseudojiufengensis TaxID=497109 RepID=UPI0022255AD8|nr:EFM5 [Candida pseudojiufengensis]KAI5962100.1 EFM5 [Candida pseudojiufengensis]